MIVKSESCLYCGNKMDSVTAKKKFCSDKCRVYYSREKEKSIIKNIPIDTHPVQQKEKPIGQEDHLPKTLADLKSMCPDNLTGFDKSSWIAENRTKYKI